jgi:hypothetical protein
MKLLITTLLLMAPPVFAASVPPGPLTRALHWRSLGPYRGGIVETVAGVASAPNRYYMGAGGGGVWESEDYGNSGKNISDGYLKNNNIGAIAVSSMSMTKPGRSVWRWIRCDTKVKE